MTITFTVAGQTSIRQRLNSGGLSALGLAGPLLSPVWTQAAPTANVGTLRFTVAAPWYAPMAGMLVPVTNGNQLGLSGLDGAPAEPAPAACAVLKIHPQARLRLEREMVATLQAAGTADQSLRPVPATVLIRNLLAPFALAQQVAAGELAMPAGEVSMYDERGLIIDPFAFAAAVAVILFATPALGAPMPGGSPAGPQAFAGIASGKFVHVVDLHGRPWTDPPGALAGISFYIGGAGSRTNAGHIGNALLQVWPDTAVISGDSDPDDIQTTPRRTKFGFSTVGTVGTTPLAWPAAGVQTPVRDTMRIVAVDPSFHLLGNRTAADRDNVKAADSKTVQEEVPQVRQGSPVTLLADGRSVLGWINQVIVGLQGGSPTASFTTGPIFLASVTYDDGAWPLPNAPGPAGQWPPAATSVPNTVAGVLSQLAALRTSGTANWVAGSNDVLVTLPAGLPNGVAIRLFPIKVLLGTSPDEQPMLWRADGAAAIVTGGTDTLIFADPFGLGALPVRGAEATLRVDAAAAWLPAAGGPPQVKLIANLAWPVGTDVSRPGAGPTNIFSMGFWRGSAPCPMLGAPSGGSSTDQNTREAPRHPTMARTESLFALQLLPAVGVADLYRSVLTGGWLTRETDTHSYRLANPGAAGAHEVHAPGVAATSQLGFDLWVAAAHRACPVDPAVDIVTLFSGGPNAGLPNNWLLLQANATSQPPIPPAAQSQSTMAGAVLQTVPAFVETPELALIPGDSVTDVQDWINTQLASWVSTPNDTELHRQMTREVLSCKFGRRDAQWALRRAIQHARDLVYIETPLFCATSHDAGAPDDDKAAVDLVGELASRLTIEPRLRVVILVPRNMPFVSGYEPWSMFFYGARTTAAQTLQMAGGTVPSPFGLRSRVVIAHPIGFPGRPLVVRTTTVIVDDVWCLTGTSSWSRRGLTFDGAIDVALTDWQLDRGAGTAIRTHRKSLMAVHLGVGPGPGGVGGGAPPSAVGAPLADWVRLHHPVSAHEAFADLLASGGGGKLLPLWNGPDSSAPDAVIPHPADVADPDGRRGATPALTMADPFP